MTLTTTFYMFILPVLIGFLRSVLIVSGVYKAPLLRSLEPYGTDHHYSPMVGLALWSLVLVSMMIWLLIGFQVLLALFLFLSIPFGLAYQYVEGWVDRYPHLFLMFPTWYWNLIVSTSRDEQRRLAYMWLRLPLRTQWMYNTHDVLFFQWTDLVLLSMV
jgi:hypothetical protein